MKGYHANIEGLTTENEFFRKVLYTSKGGQLVIMALRPGEEIGAEVHEANDQFFRIEEGEATVTIDDHEYKAVDGHVVIVPMGARHNVVNSGKGWLKLYTLYMPPHHRDGTMHETKASAMADDEEFDGRTTE